VDETLTTLMLNYVAILVSSSLYYGPWRDPKGYGFPGTAPFPETAWLPRIAGRAHVGIFYAIRDRQSSSGSSSTYPLGIRTPLHRRDPVPPALHRASG
jgi:hypothetical protein